MCTLVKQICKFSLWIAPKCVWRPGSARTHWGSWSYSTRPALGVITGGEGGEEEGKATPASGGQVLAPLAQILPPNEDPWIKFFLALPWIRSKTLPPTGHSWFVSNVLVIATCGLKKTKQLNKLTAAVTAKTWKSGNCRVVRGKSAMTCAVFFYKIIKPKIPDLLSSQRNKRPTICNRRHLKSTTD